MKYKMIKLEFYTYLIILLIKMKLKVIEPMKRFLKFLIEVSIISFLSLSFHQ